MYILFFVVLWLVVLIVSGEFYRIIDKRFLIAIPALYATLVTLLVWLAIYNFG